jgi:hypothetical protein
MGLTARRQSGGHQPLHSHSKRCGFPGSRRRGWGGGQVTLCGGGGAAGAAESEGEGGAEAGGAGAGGGEQLQVCC